MKLPFLLSGPILRRVQTEVVYIWLATSQPCSLSTNFFKINKRSFNEKYKYTEIPVHTVTKSIFVADNLFVHLLKITSKENTYFPTDTLLGYNVIFHTNNERNDLDSLGLLSEENNNRITYGKLKYPTFFIHSKKQTNILYGSCRKAHGKGKDALVIGDKLVGENHLLRTRRPAALFLLGDQIYADDISDALIPTLYNLGEKLFGTSMEDLFEVEPALKNIAYHSNLDRIQGRQKISDELCKFTSTEASNHLIRLSEFATMYILNWSPSLWEVAEAEGYYTDLVEKSGGHYRKDENNHPREPHSFDRKKFRDQLNVIKDFQQNTSHVRRLLANTPTYMMFDDHDITDDWNISKKWKDNVWNSVLGRHVVANGLACYWLFQGWGNDPTSFSEAFMDVIENYFRHPQANPIQYQRYLWEYSNWHFVAPTTPRAIFIDTRTQRFYDKGKDSGPRLLNEQAYEKLTTLVGSDKEKPMILISPAPVLEIQLIENILTDYLYPLRSKGFPVHRSLDLETWPFNSRGYAEFIEWIFTTGSRDVSVLCGDAHRAYSISVKLERVGMPPVQITQHTSSPLKNESFPSPLGTVIDKLIRTDELLISTDKVSRYMSNDFQLKKEASLHDKDILWKETLQNVKLSKCSRMETKSNIGLLNVTSKNKFLVNKKNSLFTNW
ncbi:MAG: hypothetical protein LPK00_04230 [Bacillaceae bacterium]|nr:hypothetical protein [Bacillaceae bacterium]